MQLTELKNGQGAKTTRDIVNKNFNILSDFANRELARGNIGNFDIADWIEAENGYYIIITPESTSIASNDTYLIYMSTDNGSVQVYCDIEQNVAQNKITLWSDMPFKGWVAQL